MKIDHVGYAVKNIDKAIAEFEKLGFKFEKTVEDNDRNLCICFGNNAAYRVELVSPMDKIKPSPVDTYLSKVGPTAYHFCYKSKSFSDDIKNLEVQGFRQIVPPEYAVAFSSKECIKHVVFLMGKNSGIFVIVEE